MLDSHLRALASKGSHASKARGDRAATSMATSVSCEPRANAESKVADAGFRPATHPSELPNQEREPAGSGSVL